MSNVFLNYFWGAGLSASVDGVEGLLKGPISSTLEPVADLVDGLASGPTALDLDLRETIVERVEIVHDIDEGIDGLVQHIDLGV